MNEYSSVQFSSVAQPCLTFCNPMNHVTSRSITNSQNSPKLMCIESVMPSSHLILCCPFPLPLPIPPASGSFPMSQLFSWSGQSTGVSASASALLKNIQDWSPLRLVGSPCSPRDSQESSSTPQFKSINSSKMLKKTSKIVLLVSDLNTVTNAGSQAAITQIRRARLWFLQPTLVWISENSDIAPQPPECEKPHPHPCTWVSTCMPFIIGRESRRWHPGEWTSVLIMPQSIDLHRSLPLTILLLKQITVKAPKILWHPVVRFIAPGNASNPVLCSS